MVSVVQQCNYTAVQLNSSLVGDWTMHYPRILVYGNTCGARFTPSLPRVWLASLAACEGVWYVFVGVGEPCALRVFRD